MHHLGDLSPGSHSQVGRETGTVWPSSRFARLPGDPAGGSIGRQALYRQVTRWRDSAWSRRTSC